MVVCEASAADCLYRSAAQADGNLVNVTGDLQTIMAGLACGEGNPARSEYEAGGWYGQCNCGTIRKR